MNIQNRNKDLTQIFDSRWKANHNYNVVKEAKEHDKKFIDKMFNNKNATSQTENINSMQERLERLNNNISNAKAVQMINRKNIR